MKYLEDFRVGEVIDLGTATLTEEEIVEFGRRYDPQPFHIDPEAARESVFGGLIASGWLTGSLFMRLFTTEVLNKYSNPAMVIELHRFYGSGRPTTVRNSGSAHLTGERILLR